MADIAFLLLVFFLVTTVFPKNRGLALALPQQETEVSPENVLVLEVDPEGTVAVRRGSGADVRTIRPGDVGRVWREEVRHRPGLIAAVLVDERAGYGRMIDVLDELQLAGATRISLQTPEGAGR